jgi:hypothetical protein
MNAPIAGRSPEKRGYEGFLEPWREYVVRNRHVFLEEILNFIRSSDRQELAEIRKAVWERRRALRKGGKRGRPRGSERSPLRVAQNVGVPEVEHAQTDDSPEWDPHDGFRDVCMVCGDFSHLRPVFLGQIRCLLQGAAELELRAIRQSVAERARSRELLKKRGRPGAQDDENLQYRARVAAWRRIVDGWEPERIAEALGMRVTRASANNYQGYEGNIKAVRWTLRRLEDDLAARIWDAVPPSYAVHHQDGQQDELRPGALEHKPLQQMLWIKTGLPFGTQPEQCKEIVRELWPRALHAATERSQRRILYMLGKTNN